MSDLLPCPLCGASKGYELAKGDTSRWWLAVCAGCGDFVCECRSDSSTGYNAELPTHWGPADLEWNRAAKHAHELRLGLDSANAEIERLQAELVAARRCAEYWKAEHLAGNVELERQDEAILKLITTIRYLQGIAERGEGRAIREDETIEQFVLGYVKRLEAECDALKNQEPVVTKRKSGLILHAGWDPLPVGAKLYAAPMPPSVPELSDEMLERIQLRAERSALRHNGGARGQQLTPADDFGWHLIHATRAELAAAQKPEATT